MGSPHLAALLEALRRSRDAFVSGHELAARPGLSRSAVWKQVQALRALGYHIDAHPRRGYRLGASPDLLLPPEVQSHLSTRRFGCSMEHHHEAGSTMELAWAAVARGAPEGHLVVAEVQTTARGRMRRPYFSPRGGLWWSLLLRPATTPARIAPLALVVAIGVGEGIQEATGLQLEVKWPNDLSIGRRKVVGILLEMNAEADLVRSVALGVGVNASIPRERFPEEVRAEATSLSEAVGAPVHRASLLARILEHLERRYDQFLADGLGPALEAWRRFPNNLGQPVEVHGQAEGNLAGTAEDVDEDGALLVRDAGGSRHRVVAGDVVLRGEARGGGGGR